MVKKKKLEWLKAVDSGHFQFHPTIFVCLPADDAFAAWSEELQGYMLQCSFQFDTTLPLTSKPDCLSLGNEHMKRQQPYFLCEWCWEVHVSVHQKVCLKDKEEGFIFSFWWKFWGKWRNSTTWQNLKVCVQVGLNLWPSSFRVSMLSNNQDILELSACFLLGSLLFS